MNEEYKISLGIDIEDGAISDIQRQIDSIESRIDPIQVKVEIENLADIKKQLQNLTGTNSKANALTINTDSVERSLNEVSLTIKEIKNSIGTLDSKSGMKSLLSSINQISNALGRAADESETLVKSLNALSKKDLNFNFGIDMGKKNLSTTGYGRIARKQVIPELEAQIQYLEKMFGGKQSAIAKLTKNQDIGFDVFSHFADFDSISPIKKMEAMEHYINSLKKLSAIDNVSLDGFNNQFSKSATELIDDITGIENAVNRAGDVPEKLKKLFGGGVDGEALSKHLDSIVVDLGEIKTALQGLSSGVTIDGLTQSFDKLSNTLDRLVSNVGVVQTTFGSGFGLEGVGSSITDVDQKLRRISDIKIDSLDGQIDNLKTALQGFGFADSSIDTITKDLEEMRVAVRGVTTSLNNDGSITLTVKGVDEYERAITAIKKVSLVAETGEYQIEDFGIKVSQSFNKAAEAAEKVRAKLSGSDFGFSGFDNEISSVITKFNKLSGDTGELGAHLENLENAFLQIKNAANAGDVEALVAANERYEQILKDVNNQLDIQARLEREAAAAAKLEDSRMAFQSNIDAWLTKNSAAAKKFGAQMLELKAQAKSCDAVTLKHLQSEFKRLEKEADAAGLKMQSFGDRLKTQFAKYSSYFSVASLFMYASMGLRDMFEQVKLIDSAMTELKKVTNETDASYNKFLSNAATRSKEIGTTIDGLVSSTADFARLGYGFKDAQGLAEVANIYAVVGDEIEGVEGATESLISTMAAFKDEMNGMSNSEFAMSIVDKFNEIGNNFAISSGGIGEAMERSASSLMAANNTIDESIALITAANTVVQDPAQVGKVMPTIKVAISVKLQRWTRPSKDFVYNY